MVDLGHTKVIKRRYKRRRCDDFEHFVRFYSDFLSLTLFLLQNIKAEVCFECSNVPMPLPANDEIVASLGRCGRAVFITCVTVLITVENARITTISPVRSARFGRLAKSVQNVITRPVRKGAKSTSSKCLKIHRLS